MMQNHAFEPGTPRPTGAVTFPQDWFGHVLRPTTCASRFFDSSHIWREGGGYHLNSSDNTLIVFSDGTHGVTAEGRLEAALAAYDVELGR